MTIEQQQTELREWLDSMLWSMLRRRWLLRAAQFTDVDAYHAAVQRIVDDELDDILAGMTERGAVLETAPDGRTVYCWGGTSEALAKMGYTSTAPLQAAK